MRRICISCPRATHILVLAMSLLVGVLTTPTFAAIVNFTVKFPPNLAENNTNIDNFFGNINYDETKINPVGTSSINANNGLKVNFDFVIYDGGAYSHHSFSEKDDDLASSGYPQATFHDSVLVGLSFGTSNGIVFVFGNAADGYSSAGRDFYYLNTNAEAVSASVEFDTPTDVVPLPAALPLLASALLGLGIVGRRAGSTAPG
ncbi:MAG: hypothetical protein U1E45_00435 [Geminicoccaceae bacterium]